MPRLKHKHAWRSRMHMDGCHWYAWSYDCECGASVGTRTERDFQDDPYSMVWAEPRTRTINRDAKGKFITPRTEEVKCERCTELQNGARPRHAVEFRHGKVTHHHEHEIPEQPHHEEDE